MRFRWLGCHQVLQNVTAQGPEALRQHDRSPPPGLPEPPRPPQQRLAQQQTLQHPRRPHAPPLPQRPLALRQHQRAHRLPGRRHLLAAGLHPLLGVIGQGPHPPPARAFAASNDVGQLLVGEAPAQVFLDRVVTHTGRVAARRHQAVRERCRLPLAVAADVPPLHHLDLGPRPPAQRHHAHPPVVLPRLVRSAVRTPPQHPGTKLSRRFLDVAAQRDEDRHADRRRSPGARGAGTAGDTTRRSPRFPPTQHDPPGSRQGDDSHPDQNPPSQCHSS